MNKRTYDDYVIQVVEHKTLSKAAVYLGISQPALSSGLTALEKELGFKIFNRKKIPISLTEEGELYYEYIKRLKVLEEDFQIRLQSHQNHSSNYVTVGGPVAYLETIVSNAVIKLCEENPEYHVSMKCFRLHDLINMAQKGDINCFISTSNDIPDNFENKLIKQEKIYLCIPSCNSINSQICDYKVLLGETKDCFDFSILNGQEFIFLEKNQPLREQMDLFFNKYHISPVNKIVVNQASTAISLTAKGKGICFASEETLSKTAHLNKVCIYSLPDSISRRNIYISYNKELFMPKACSDLIKYLQSYS